MSISFPESNNDYLVISDDASLTLPDDDWAIGVWTFVSNNGGSLIQNLYDNNYDTTPYVYLHLRETSIGSNPNEWQARINDGSFDESLVSSSTPGADSTWRLIIIQRDTTASEVQMWFCEPGQTAVKEDSVSDSGLGAMNCGDWYIGSRADTPGTDRNYGSLACEFWKGDFALSQAEIEAMGAGRPIYAIGREPDVYLPMIAAVATVHDLFGGNDAAQNDTGLTSAEHAPVGGVCGPSVVTRGAVTNSQPAAGTLTSAGGIVRETDTTEAGTLTSAGAVVKLTAPQALAGTLTSAGAIVKQTATSVAGTLTSAGAVVKVVAPQALTGTLTSAGALVRQAGKGLSGTLTTAGAVVKQVAVSTAGTLTTAGAVIKQAGKSLAGTLTTAGTVAKLAAISVAGTLTSAGAAVKQAGKSLAGSLSSGGTVSAVTTYLRSLAGTLTTSGALSRLMGRGLSGTLTTAGAVARRISYSLAGTLTSAGSLIPGFVRSVGPIVRGADGAVDSVIRQTQINPPRIKGGSEL